MVPVHVDPDRVREFVDAKRFEQWLSKHHAKETELWIKIHKVNSGLPSITPKEAVDVVLCWGWIDAIRKSYDGTSFLQRYTPRTKKSIWSQVNVQNVSRLLEDKRMTPHGLREVEAAKADGRWARAYASGKEMTIPPDLQAAIAAVPKARKMFATLSAQNRFALAFRVGNMKTEAGRQNKIALFVDMLTKEQTFYPQGKGKRT